MNAIRVQIHLKYFSDENSSKQFHNFWYAFEPKKLLTIKDVLEDIHGNYLKDQQELIVQLDDCQLLPFTSSQILRDNDQLTLIPLAKHNLQRKSLQDSVNFNLPSSIAMEPSIIVPEHRHKRHRLDSNIQSISTESTITIIPTIEKVEEAPRKKKTKTETPENQSKPEPAMVNEPVIEKEAVCELPISVPSTNGRLRELKSKTPAWKSQTSTVKGNVQEKLHIRFDSDSDEEAPLPPPEPEPSLKIPISIEKTNSVESQPVINDSNASTRIHYVSTPVSSDIEKPSSEKQTPQKTIDLLFEMKQHKTVQEKEAKKIQQQYGRKRSQHRKRALSYFSIATFVDRAFGLNADETEKQTTTNGHHSSSSSASSPQTLPTSFSKKARLPLIAEAIENNDKIYDLYPPITQIPPIQTRLAFKLLELSETFCPTMSQYKEGTVTNMNETTGEVTIQLDKPLQSVFDQPSKFYAPTDEMPVVEEENSTTVTLPFSELNSVRLLPT
ncbi:unnamed protein product [Adineta ricciae]|uniref:Coilin tudor domain-containing protein n=1 Tax=Adineta ricciae TaxID=249248 RepID=A0A816CKZ4_ADIRI|nr:unnamed protein product [Adineta ricciae]CAF1622606.1 unnamed protein product [Adineta ricciae]